MDNEEAELPFEWVEIVVAMQQRMSRLYAEGRKQAIDGFAHGMSMTTQSPVILGCRMARSMLTVGNTF